MIENVSIRPKTNYISGVTHFIALIALGALSNAPMLMLNIIWKFLSAAYRSVRSRNGARTKSGERANERKRRCNCFVGLVFAGACVRAAATAAANGSFAHRHFPLSL